MTRNKWIVLGGVLAALVIAVAMGARAAYADTTTPPAPPDDRGAPPGGVRPMHRLDPAGLEAAGGVLGMSPDELSTQLENGKKLEELATEKGVDIDTVRAAIQAAHQQEMLENIKQAVTDGKMTQDKADWLIVGLENGYLDGRGFGIGPGLGFGGPRGRGPAGEATPAT